MIKIDSRIGSKELVHALPSEYHEVTTLPYGDASFILDGKSHGFELKTPEDFASSLLTGAHVNAKPTPQALRGLPNGRLRDQLAGMSELYDYSYIVIVGRPVEKGGRFGYIKGGVWRPTHTALSWRQYDDVNAVLKAADLKPAVVAGKRDAAKLLLMASGLFVADSTPDPDDVEAQTLRGEQGDTHNYEVPNAELSLAEKRWVELTEAASGYVPSAYIAPFKRPFAHLGQSPYTAGGIEDVKNGTCDNCGKTGLKAHFLITSSDDKTFRVGSRCINQLEKANRVGRLHPDDRAIFESLDRARKVRGCNERWAREKPDFVAACEGWPSIYRASLDVEDKLIRSAWRKLAKMPKGHQGSRAEIIRQNLAINHGDVLRAILGRLKLSHLGGQLDGPFNLLPVTSTHRSCSWEAESVFFTFFATRPGESAGGLVEIPLPAKVYQGFPDFGKTVFTYHGTLKHPGSGWDGPVPQHWLWQSPCRNGRLVRKYNTKGTKGQTFHVQAATSPDFPEWAWDDEITHPLTVDTLG